MSWMVDGTMYHDIAGRDRALERQRARMANAAANHLSRELADARAQVALREQALRETRDDLRRQTELNEALQHDVNRIADIQNRMQREQDRLEARVRADFEDLRGQVNQTQDDLAELERQQQKHVEAVRSSFVQVRAELQRGLEDAEARRAELQRELSEEIRRVDDKLEAERRRRLEQLENDRQRSEAAITMAEEGLEKLEGELGALELDEHVHDVRENIAQARRCLGEQQHAQALGSATQASSATRALAAKIRLRRSKLLAQHNAVEDQIKQLRSMLDEPNFATWFPSESKRLCGFLDKLEARVGDRYRRWVRLGPEAHEDEQIVGRIAQDVAHMYTTVGEVAELAEQRKQLARKLSARLTRIYGTPTALEMNFAEPSDPKSALVLRYQFGGPRVDVQLELEGGFKLDAYKHGNNSVCQGQANAVMRELGHDFQVREQAVSDSNREAPLEEGRASASTWTSLEQSIDKTGGML